MVTESGVDCGRVAAENAEWHCNAEVEVRMGLILPLSEPQNLSNEGAKLKSIFLGAFLQSG